MTTKLLRESRTHFYNIVNLCEQIDSQALYAELVSLTRSVEAALHPQQVSDSIQEVITFIGTINEECPPEILNEIEDIAVSLDEKIVGY